LRRRTLEQLAWSGACDEIIAAPRSVARGGGTMRTLGEADNFNGSARAIAGIFNDSRTILGLMPHPENATDPLLGGIDGQAFFDGLVGALQ